MTLRLWSIAGLAALLAAAAPVPFADSPHPPAPDYADASNWMTLEGAAKGKSADLFYIHPTTLKSQAWNQDPADADANRWTDISVGARQVSAFAACCRRFAPRYRQATTRAFYAPQAEGDRAYGLAYEDVRAAFRAFIARHNDNRPFILAGHSQGALHGLRLLREEIAGTPLADRLVVAYLPGIGIPASALPGDVAPCTTPAQTRCVASWNSFTPEADTQAFITRSLARHGAATSDALICVNPISFSAKRPATTFAKSKGALPGPAVEGRLPRPVKAMVEAHCDGNVLRVKTRPGLAVETLPGGNLHMADIALFWADLGADADRRARAFSNRRK